LAFSSTKRFDFTSSEFLLRPCSMLVSLIDMNTMDNLKPPSQHINLCSSLHRRNGARTVPLVESHLLLYEEWWGKRESLYFFYCPDRPLYMSIWRYERRFPLSMLAQVEALYRESIL
jgi:hypothetical protein